MKLGSLCTGFGGLDMAVEAHYDTTLCWVAEDNKDCSKVLAHHWPTVPNLGDISQVNWSQVEPVDVLTAGYPCQPYSHAGRRKGEDDERAIFAYIADAIGILRPRIVCLENVAAHTSLGSPGVVATLTELGYNDIRWGVVRASDAGAPHRRARWFCVAADSDGSGRGEQRGAIPMEPEQRPVERGGGETEWGKFAPAVATWERTIGRPAPSPTLNGQLSSRFVEWLMGLPEDHVCGVGLSRTAELKMLGNGVVPQQASLALEVLDQLAGILQAGTTRRVPPIYLETPAR